MCPCVHTQAPKGPSAHNSCSLRGGTCPPEPCSGFCEVPGCPIPTYRGKEGLRRGARAGGGEGLTPCSLSLAHLEVPIRSASPGQWPEVSGRVEPSFPWPHSQELGSCGTLLPLWGSSEGSGRQDPGSLASLCWRNTPSGRIRTARSAGPPRWAPPDSGVGSQGRGFPGYRAPDWLPRGQVTEPLPALLSSQGPLSGVTEGGREGRMGPSLDSGMRAASLQAPGLI